MEITRSIFTYTALAVLLTLPSCVQEGPGGDEQTGDGNIIYFRSYLPSITETRAGVITKDNLSECRITSINPEDFYLTDPTTGEISAYFHDIRFIKDAEGRFLTQNESAGLWPDYRSRLHFFAYHPSVESMCRTIDSDKFKLVNYTKKSGETVNIDYRLESFKVAQDIANQVDFITAYSNGTQQENGKTGITLNFSHQLARIELSAWGESEKYDFEIAGVRIGNPLTEGDFKFSSSSQTYPWINTKTDKPVEHVFGPGESIIYVTKEAASIMGKGGPAMVIPMKEKVEAWEGNADPATSLPKYSTKKMYFSVLLRVKNKNNEIVYPYPNDKDNIPVTYLAVKSDGTGDTKVVRRVYLIKGKYYTTDKENEEFMYTPGTMEDIHGYCWASLPVAAKWEAGKIYTYKLNYTTGIGWQDPSDPNPGDPIIERGMVPFEVSVEEWVAAEDYNSDLNVPKR